MMLSDDGVKLIQSFESYMEKLPDGRCQAYQCIVGYKRGKPIYDGKWTIAWGCTSGVTEGLVWTRAQAEQAFREELSGFEAAVNRLVKVPISQNAFDALVSFAYNCGESALAKSSLLKKVNAGDMIGAASEFSKWTNSNGVKNVPGLVRRRAEEKAMFLRPDAPPPMKAKTKAAEAPAAAPAMPQTVDAPAPFKQMVQNSRTFAGGLLTIFGIIAGFFKDVIAETASQISALAPLKDILGGFGLDAAKILLIVTLAGCLYSLYAKLDDTLKGRVVK